MFFESKQSKEVERRDFIEQGAERLKELSPFLRELSMELKKKGFPVNDQGRLEEGFFNFPKEEIERDKKRVEQAEESFSKRDNSMGELLEVVKTLAFNKSWFSKKFVALRTAQFDDYFNGVDEIIFDVESKEPLAAVDETTDFRQKIEQMKRKIVKGSEVKYGVSLEDGINQKSLDYLPTFIISLNYEELIDLSDALLNGERSDLLEKKVIGSLKNQSREFQGITSSTMKLNYLKAEKIFNKISL